MWVRARNIFDELSKFVAASGKVNESQAAQLMNLLSTNSSLLVNILRNEGKSAVHRSELELHKIVKLPNGHSMQLDAEMKNEAIIISDTFNCDELEALELIASAQIQCLRFGFWARGLCAVVCYYDTHRLLSAATKALLQLKLSDGLSLTPALSAFVTQFCANPALAKRLIEVTQINIATEMQILHRPSVNGLGGPKHQQLVHTLIEETITNCRDALYMLCSSWNEECVPHFLVDLLAPLRELTPTSSFANTHLRMWTAVLILISPHSINNTRSMSAVLEGFGKELKENWSDMCLLASLQLAYAISCTWMNANRSPSEAEIYALPNEDDISSLLSNALDAMTFSFLRCSIIKAAGFREDSAAFDALDTLIKLFIIHFSDKLVLLRRACEEELSEIDMTEKRGRVPDSPLHFEKFLRLIADLYDHDSLLTTSSATHFLSAESPALSRFLRSGKEISSPVLQITYLDMLKNLCKNREMATFIFKLLSTTHRATADTISFNHFCWAIRGYLDTFRQKRLPEVAADRAFKMKLEIGQHLSQEEIAGLVAWTQLAAVVALHDPYACRQFASDGMLMVDGMTGLIATAIPLVLKGAFYRFLSVLARDGMIAEKIWILLRSHSVLTTAPDGRLSGIRRELEERECAIRSYDSSLGFLHLMRAFMLHPTKTFDDGRILPCIRFIIKSIISQFLYRSYQREEQMWELCLVSCDTLCNLLKYYVVTDASLINEHPQIFVLVQIFSKSPVFHSIAGMLVIGSAQLESCGSDRYEALEACTLSVLRLLHTCVSQHAGLTEAIRSVKSNMLIASLDSLLLDRLSADTETTYLAVIASFVMQSEHMPLHAYWAARILRELCASRRALQTEIVHCLRPLGSTFVEYCARITSPTITHLAVSPIDAPVLFDVESLSRSRVYGETARILIELCTTSVEMDPSIPSIGYLLCGFDITNLLGTRLENPGINGTTRTCLHSVIDTLEMLADSHHPYALPFSALFEPMLRFLLRLVSADGPCGDLVLRFLRSNYDLIFRMLSSRAVIPSNTVVSGEEGVVLKNTERMIQGYVLHLSAIEVSSLLKIRHYSQPSRFYNLLLRSDGDFTGLFSSSSNNGQVLARGLQAALLENAHDEGRSGFLDSSSTTDSVLEVARSQSTSVDSPVEVEESSSFFVPARIVNSSGDVASDRMSESYTSIVDSSGERLLWKFLKLVEVNFVMPQKPHLEMFNLEKLDKIASLCDRPTASNVEQWDIERMHWLLKREALSVIGEMQQEGINNITTEVREVLRYCVAYNLQRSGKASAQQLLTGWISITSVLSAFAPVPFISLGHHADMLNDALRLLLMEYTTARDLNPQVYVAMSRCVCTLTNAACYSYVRSAIDEYSLRRSISEMLSSVIRCIVYPSGSSYHNRHDMYLCVLRLLTSVTAKFDSNAHGLEERQEEEEDMFGLNKPIPDPIRAVVSLYADELIKVIRDDICSSRSDSKVVVLLCMAHLLREDSLGPQSLAHLFTRSGLLRCVLVSVARTSVSNAETVANLQALEYLKAVLVLFIPLAMSESGWKGLSEEHALEILAALPLWNVPPKEAFTTEERSSQFAEVFMGIVELKVRFCLAMCANPRWRCISDKALCLIACSSELLNHSMRNDQHSPLVQASAMLVSRVYKLEESSRAYIDKSTCLSGLRTVPLDSGSVQEQSTSIPEPSFNTPRRLFMTNNANCS